jgi:hypothetical protein
MPSARRVGSLDRSLVVTADGRFASWGSMLARGSIDRPKIAVTSAPSGIPVIV